MKKGVSAAELVQNIKSGQRVFIHGAAATPNVLIEALVNRAEESPNQLENVELIHLHTVGPARYVEPQFRKNFRVINLFVGPNLRPHMDYEGVDYLPCFLSEIPNLFRSDKCHLDVALIQVSPPDVHGYCSLGTSVDVAKAAVESSKLVLAQINQQMPRVHGDGFIHLSQVDQFVEVNVPLPESPRPVLQEEEIKIGQHIANLIEDGSTLQVGIGTIPDAALTALRNHKHLGVHTEMWSDGMLDLIKSGAIDNSRKTVHPGKIVAGFSSGTRALYDFMHDNPNVVHLDIAYVNNPTIIARNAKVAAINSAVEVDLTGQICADSVGSRIISGVGGQMDFIRGASLSKGGKPIIALTSRARKKVSRLVPVLKSGAGVVTTRAHVHYIVTEYGVVDLYGKTLGERAQSLIQIAHPDDQENLERSWHEYFRRSK